MYPAMRMIGTMIIMRKKMSSLGSGDRLGYYET